MYTFFSQVEKEERAKLEAEQAAATQQDQWAGLGPTATEGLPAEPTDVSSMCVCVCAHACVCVRACVLLMKSWEPSMLCSTELIDRIFVFISGFMELPIHYIFFPP